MESLNSKKRHDKTKKDAIPIELMKMKQLETISGITNSFVFNKKISNRWIDKASTYNSWQYDTHTRTYIVIPTSNALAYQK